VRVTVIATGFPTPGVAPRGTQLFSFGGREKEVDEPVGKIFNAPEPAKDEKKPNIPVIGEIDPLPSKQAAKKEEDDDEWGAVPSFLRRPKIK
jgi:hypothetical protein